MKITQKMIKNEKFNINKVFWWKKINKENENLDNDNKI